MGKKNQPAAKKEAKPEGTAKKIRMNVSIAGLDFSYYPGQELTPGIDIEPDLAEKWVSVGHASPLGGEGNEPDTMEQAGTGQTSQEGDTAGGGAGDAGDSKEPSEG